MTPATGDEQPASVERRVAAGEALDRFAEPTHRLEMLGLRVAHLPAELVASHPHVAHASTGNSAGRNAPTIDSKAGT